MSSYLLCIDQGTTSSRAVVFDDKAQMVATSQKSFEQHFPQDAVQTVIGGLDANTGL